MYQSMKDKCHTEKVRSYINGAQVSSVTFGEAPADDAFERGIEGLRGEIDRLQELRAALPREMPNQAARHLAEQIRRPWSFYEKQYPTDAAVSAGNVVGVIEARINQLELAISDIHSFLCVLPVVVSPGVNRLLAVMAHSTKV